MRNHKRLCYNEFRGLFLLFKFLFCKLILPEKSLFLVDLCINYTIIHILV